MDEREITTSVDMKSIKSLCEEYKKYNYIPPELYERFDIKRGLRNQDGTGVIAGLTHICNVHGYVLNEGEKAPIDGQLIYRGKMCIRDSPFCFRNSCSFSLLPDYTDMLVTMNIPADSKSEREKLDFIQSVLLNGGNMSNIQA